MWIRYRQVKHVLTFPLAFVAALCLNASEDSAPWFIGAGIVTLFGTAYVAEEIVWMAQNRGRPCPDCGQRVNLRPFTLQFRCPHCRRIMQ